MGLLRRTTGEKPKQGLIKVRTTLVARHLDPNGKEIGCRIVRDKVVTNVFVQDIVDCLTGTTADLTTFKNYKWHAYGTSTAAEAAANTALTTKVGNYRTGTQVEGTSANAYKSVCTVSATGTHAITEHGLFNSSAGLALMDRTKFAAINVTSGDKIEFTFTIQFSSGG